MAAVPGTLISIVQAMATTASDFDHRFRCMRAPGGVPIGHEINGASLNGLYENSVVILAYRSTKRRGDNSSGGYVPCLFGASDSPSRHLSSLRCSKHS